MIASMHGLPVQRTLVGADGTKLIRCGRIILIPEHIQKDAVNSKVAALRLRVAPRSSLEEELARNSELREIIVREPVFIQSTNMSAWSEARGDALVVMGAYLNGKLGTGVFIFPPKSAWVACVD